MDFKIKVGLSFSNTITKEENKLSTGNKLKEKIIKTLNSIIHGLLNLDKIQIEETVFKSVSLFNKLRP